MAAATATRKLTRSLLTTTKQSILSSITTRSYTTTSKLLRPLASLKHVPFSFTTRCFSTRHALNDSNQNWSNRPPKETILLEGCDFEHWLVVMEEPKDQTRDEIIHGYIKTLATVLGSENEARMKIYSVSTKHYFAFGALVSEELSLKLKELPNVRWVLPDSYLDVRNKDYGGEPFIDGQAVPYHPKYHEEWVRNHINTEEKNRRKDRPRNSRNFERRRDTAVNNQNPGPNSGQMQPNMHQQQQQPNYNRGAPPTNTGNYNNPGPNNPQTHQYANAPNYQPGPSPNQNFNQNPGSGYGPAQGQNPNSFTQNPGSKSGWLCSKHWTSSIANSRWVLARTAMRQMQVGEVSTEMRTCLDEMCPKLLVTEQ